ncbi:MAG: membrane protein insertase YidC, partial [Rickettsiales bacterium]|nr:membrane protein insertase YidC [Rickettsiales bacterium]
LKGYKETRAENSPDVRLLNYARPDELSKAEYAEFGLLADNADIPTKETKWNVVSSSPTEIKLAWTNRDKVKFERTLGFDDGYLLRVEDKISNSSKSPLTFHPYARVVSAFDTRQSPSSHTGLVGFVDGSLVEKTYSDLAGKQPFEVDGAKGWFGFGTNYFMSVLLPPEGAAVKISARELPSHTPAPTKQFQADYVAPALTVAPGAETKIEYRAYLGAKESALLERYEKELSLPRFDLAVDYGMFYFLSKPFSTTLGWLHGLTGNFGLAIILFTLMIRVLLFPMAHKSFKSMEKMKRLQPDMKRIQTMYANDRQRMNLELAMLYKSNGVNPLSGCLPLLLQLPVFLALYKALVISIEMRQAPFVWWISDLSAHDPYYILPVLMGITMWAQQRMQPAPDVAQNKVMKWLPVIFTVMFAGLPSGLVLYWTTNNILSILQQRFVR